MKITYYNDSRREILIHPATFKHGCKGSEEPIKPLEERTFILPDNTSPFIKMWDYGVDKGLQILIMPEK
ncbi:hypothetical protein [Piscibacillus salipiscarius]|uniref:Uncharacterized protein n=1 Tax=Piscibacillus salipiscarius TaxID=299480 RepID=A0ABW5Q815_9BACI|nr:hypothetical protein [Piscibacillus salipiscarius]